MAWQDLGENLRRLKEVLETVSDPISLASQIWHLSVKTEGGEILQDKVAILYSDIRMSLKEGTTFKTRTPQDTLSPRVRRAHKQVCDALELWELFEQSRGA